MYGINNSVFCVYFSAYGLCLLQYSLLGVQYLSAVLSDSACSPAAGTLPPVGPLLKAGGGKFGGSG